MAPFVLDHEAEKARSSIVHLVVLRDKGLLVFVLLYDVLGFEAGLSERLSRRVVNADAARTTAPGVDDGRGVDFLEILLLHAPDASNANTDECRVRDR